VVVVVMGTFISLGGGLALAKAPLVVDHDQVDCPRAAFPTIQAAVDAASSGDTIRVCAGVYAENVVIGTSGITLKAEPGAILDGSTRGNGDGITLQSGVSGVTIKYFEIRNYTGISNGVGNAIQAWNCGTSDISVVGNYMHDNAWNAILVGNEGEALHHRWSVKDNRVVNNGFYNIELTNTQDSEIKNNVVTGPGGGVQAIGILLQARSWWQDGLNYLGCTDPLTEILASGNVISSGNVVSGFEEGSFGGGEGVRLLAFSGANGIATLTDTRVTENQVFDNDRYAILVFGATVCVDPTQGGNLSDCDVPADITSTDDVTTSWISRNYLHDNGRDGIRFLNGDNSHVSDNTVTDNGWHGIRLGSGSTGNQVSDNTATGNGDGISFFDLFHDASSTPNTWEDNTCGTKSGADIPLC